MFYWSPQSRPATEEVALLHVQQIISRMCVSGTLLGDVGLLSVVRHFIIIIIILIVIISKGTRFSRRAQVTRSRSGAAAAAASAAIY